VEERTEYTTAPPVIDQAAIDAYRQRQAEQCAAAIEAVLKQHRCEMQVAPCLTPDGRVAATVQIACIG
jgi:hypothetical protein